MSRMLMSRRLASPPLTGDEGQKCGRHVHIESRLAFSLPLPWRAALRSPARMSRQRKITAERLKDAGAKAQAAALATTSKTLKTPLPEELLKVEYAGKADAEAPMKARAAHG